MRINPIPGNFYGLSGFTIATSNWIISTPISRLNFVHRNLENYGIYVVSDQWDQITVFAQKPAGN